MNGPQGQTLILFRGALQPGELLPMTCRLAAIDMKVDETAKLEWKQPLLDVQWFAGFFWNHLCWEAQAHCCLSNCIVVHRRR